MRQRPQDRRWLALVFGLALGGCGTPAASPRGFGSQQVLPLRDGWLDLGMFTEDESRLYVGRFVQMPAPFGPQPPADISTIDLVTGELRAVTPAAISMTALAGAPGHGRTTAFVHYPSAADVPADYLSITGPLPGRLVLSFVDEGSADRLEIPDVSGATRGRIALGGAATDPIAVARLDPAGDTRLWFGPPATLRAAPPSVLTILGFDSAAAFAHSRSDTDAGQPVIERLPFDGSAPSLVVPAKLGDHVSIADQTGNATTLPSGLSGPREPRTDCRGGGPATPCMFLYSRVTAFNDIAHLFARSADEPRELALPGELSNPERVAMGANFVLWAALTSSGGRLFSWKYGEPQVGGCDAPVGAVVNVVRSPTARLFAARVAETRPDGEISWDTARWVLGTPGGECHLTENILDSPVLAFSPDEETLLWVESGISQSVVHLTNVESGANRAITLTGNIYGAHYLDTRRLLLLRSSGDGTGMSWIDLESASVADNHIIGDGVASWIWLNARWLLIGDAKSAQDDTFVLRLVDVDTGASQIISRSVADYSIPCMMPPPGATVLPVAYLVRGRGPSAQDGLWLAHLPLADFPAN